MNTRQPSPARAIPAEPTAPTPIPFLSKGAPP